MYTTAPIACRNGRKYRPSTTAMRRAMMPSRKVGRTSPIKSSSAEVAKAVQAAARAPEPARLLELCCGRGGGLAYLDAALSPRATIGIDRSLAAIRHRRNGNAASAHLQGHALQLP